MSTLIDSISFILNIYCTRQAVSAHALSVILNSSPRHPTLLSILLAVSLQYGLTSDACVILRELLLVSSQSTIPAISTSTSLPTIPPLASSSNSEFLVSLLQECTSSSAHGAILAHINHREFTRIFVEVLSEEGHGGVEVWTCKAVRRLARKLRSEDLPAAINLCVGLSQAIGKTPPTKCSKEKKLRDRSIMEDRLSGWLESTLDALRRSESAEDFEFVVDMLLEVGSLNHLRNSVTTSLRDMVQCLTVLCLTSPSHRFRTSDQEHALSRLLRGTSPSTEAYEGLVGLILEDLPSLILETVIPTLEEWALPLRLHALLVHEASLWAGALRFLEDQFTPGAQDVPAPTIHIQTFERLRAQLVDRVEDAESRCFGATASNSESLPTKKPEEGEWRWEEMVGAWIRKSPLITRTIQRPKLQRELRALQGNRRKRSSIDDELTSPSRNKRLKPTSPLTSSISSASSSYPSSRSSRVSPSLSPSKTSWSIQDDWTPPSSPLLSDSENVTPKPHIPESWRGVSNFDSMLADAQLNRTVLHTHDISHPKPITTVQFQANDTFGGRRISWPQNLSSDDALNLFDWSSPVTTRV